jgi:hypothetical protein
VALSRRRLWQISHLSDFIQHIRKNKGFSKDHFCIVGQGTPGCCAALYIHLKTPKLAGKGVPAAASVFAPPRPSFPAHCMRPCSPGPPPSSLGRPFFSQNFHYRSLRVIPPF